MKFDTQKIISSNPLEVWLDKYGIKTNKKGFANCPFHNEKTPSFRVYKENDSFYCFGCGVGGDVITLIMKMENLSFEDACAFLDRDITYSEQRKIDRRKRQRITEEKRRNLAADNYWSAFDDWKNNEDIIALFKPSGPDETPCCEFLNALKFREILTQRLDEAETIYVKKAGD